MNQKPQMPEPVQWTPAKVKKFRKAYESAVANSAAIFTCPEVTGQQAIDTGFAKYLLEYLDMRFADDK